MFTIATFYRFIELENYVDMKGPIREFCLEQSIKGTILLAEEGINATISGIDESIKLFFAFLATDSRLSGLEWKTSYAPYKPFERIKIRLKREIVSLMVNDLNLSKRGQYIAPENWDAFILRDDVTLIDTRNIYEIRFGTFNGSVNPETYNFRDLPYLIKKLNLDKKRKIAMFCTGGVRCEKSTAYMKHLGFESVYHLEGGILNYFKKTRNKNKLWSGDCFVFDDRVAVDEYLHPSNKIKCFKCLKKVSNDDLKSLTRGNVICKSCAS